MNIPKFLIEMSKQMHTQPNRSKSDPFWQVRCKRYMVTEEGYNDHHFELCHDDGSFYRSDTDENRVGISYLVENHFDWCVNYVKYHSFNEEENVTDEGEIYEFMDDHFDTESDELPSEIRKVHMQEHEDIVSTHLTEADAKWFIGRNQHNYPNLYTYVESAYWSPQIKELRAWILSLTKGE